jgi:hypothetical protein
MNTATHSRRTKAPSRPRPAASKVTRAELDALRDRIAELEDIVHARRVAETTPPENFLPAELVNRMLAGEHPVRIWREHRKLTLSGLATKAGIPKSYLSTIESKKKPGSTAAYKALATALGVAIDDLV